MVPFTNVSGYTEQKAVTELRPDEHIRGEKTHLERRRGVREYFCWMMSGKDPFCPFQENWSEFKFRLRAAGATASVQLVCVCRHNEVCLLQTTLFFYRVYSLLWPKNYPLSDKLTFRRRGFSDKVPQWAHSPGGQMVYHVVGHMRLEEWNLFSFCFKCQFCWGQTPSHQSENSRILEKTASCSLILFC